jgi:hypothetical protein
MFEDRRGAPPPSPKKQRNTVLPSSLDSVLMDSRPEMERQCITAQQASRDSDQGVMMCISKLLSVWREKTLSFLSMIKILKWGALVGSDIFQSTQHSLLCTQANPITFHSPRTTLRYPKTNPSSESSSTATSRTMHSLSRGKKPLDCPFPPTPACLLCCCCHTSTLSRSIASLYPADGKAMTARRATQ